MKVETITEQLLFSTLRIVAPRDGKPDSIGTGFIVNHEWTDDRKGAILITNRHVVDNTIRGHVTFTLVDGSKDDSVPLLGKAITVNLSEDGWRWTYHPSDHIDIAALPLSPIVNHLGSVGKMPFYKGIPTDIIPSQDMLESLDAVEEVLFVGYPSGIYDQANNLPMFRKGITATPLYIDYESKPLFLIDASVFPGSSGSPVFIYNNGSWSTRDGRLMSGRRTWFLGVLASVYQREEERLLRLQEISAAVSASNQDFSDD